MTGFLATHLLYFSTESLSQRRFVDEVSGMMLGRESEIELLLSYALGNSDRLQMGGENIY